ncbi:MAG: hypothetical protein K8M05_39275 [Deltaproteobacteria bacterium]|nr:hypothetical protein [Kofleriaceae bacterium]
MRAPSLLLVAGVVWLTACGGDDPVCGDGVMEGGEQCDDGDGDELDECRACEVFVPPRNVVKWAFNSEAAPGFTNDGCLDVGAITVQIDLDGPLPSQQQVSCAMRQVTYSELPAGSYTVSVTPLDSGGASLVTAPVTTTMDANVTYNTTAEVTVVVPPDAWARPMTGTFFFLLRWMGMECSTAAPAVAMQRVALRVNGSPVTQQANVGSTVYPVYTLDGSAQVTCVMASLAQAEAARMVPFGRAELEVSGRDTGGTEWFRGTFDTFVGAGVSNPIMTFDVPSVIDAGIDAPIDAPDVDAGVDAPTDAAPDA